MSKFKKEMTPSKKLENYFQLIYETLIFLTNLYKKKKYSNISSKLDNKIK
jgi:hypothetical protein